MHYLFPAFYLPSPLLLDHILLLEIYSMVALHYKRYFTFLSFLPFFFVSFLPFPLPWSIYIFLPSVFFIPIFLRSTLHGLFWFGFGFGLVWPVASVSCRYFLEGFLGRAHSQSFLGSGLVSLGVLDGVNRSTYLWRMLESIFTRGAG